MNEKPKSFMGFVNPFGKGKKASRHSFELRSRNQY